MAKNKTFAVVGPMPPRMAGVALQLYTLSKFLKKDGHKVIMVDTTVYPISPKTFKDKIKKAIKQPLKLTFNMLKIIKKVDNIYVGGTIYWGFMPPFVVLIIGKLFRKKVVMGMYVGGIVKFFSVFSVLKPVLKFFDGITVQSLYLKNEFEEIGYDNVAIVPDLIDLSNFKYRVRECIKPNLIWLKHIGPAGNPKMAVEVIEILKEKGIPDVKLYMVGTGPLENEIKNIIKEKALEKNIIMTGIFKYGELERLVELCYKADIFILTSIRDNFPRVVLEAWACGLPVVATNAGGVPHMVKNGHTGLIVNMNDSEAMANEIMKLLNTPLLVKKLSVNGHEESKKMTWDSLRCRYYELFGVGCEK